MNTIQHDINDSLRKWIHLGLLLLAIAYPLALHAGVLNGNLLAPSLILLLLLMVFGALELLKGRTAGWLIVVSALLCCGWLLIQRPDTVKLLQLPPILINGSLFILFTMTLLPRQTPLITRFAQLMHQNERPLKAIELRYTRRVTLFWSLMFAFLTIESALLARYASAETWSLITNFINYLLVVAAMLIEYRIRVRKLPHLEHPGFVNFVRLVRRMEWRSLL